MFHSDLIHTMICTSYTKNYSIECRIFKKNDYVIHEFENCKKTELSFQSHLHFICFLS